MTIEFFMPMIPPTVTNQMHRISSRGKKVIVYDSPELAEAKTKLRTYLSYHKPDAPFTLPVRLITKWLFPLCSNHVDGEYKATKPDTDNLQKALKDCMTKEGFWRDDALVASEITEKFWAAYPGIYIKIEELP